MEKKYKYRYQDLLENNPFDYHKKNLLSLDSYPFYKKSELISLAKERNIEVDTSGWFGQLGKGVCYLLDLELNGFAIEDIEEEVYFNRFELIRNGDVVTRIKLLSDIKHQGFRILFLDYVIECKSFDEIINDENILPLIPLQFTSIYIEIITDDKIIEPLKYSITYGYAVQDIRRLLATSVIMWNKYFTYRGLLLLYEQNKYYTFDGLLCQFIKNKKIDKMDITPRNPWKFKFDEVINEIKMMYPFKTENMIFEGGEEYIKTKNHFNNFIKG